MVKPFSTNVLQARLTSGKRLIAQQITIENDRETIREYAADLAIANRKLKKMALQDSLTDLPNRRAAMNVIKQKWGARKQAKGLMACLMIDVDNFKMVNDTYGHDFGDVILQKVADRLRKNIRTNDFVCRLGGEEFLVICHNTDLAGSKQLGDRLRQGIASKPMCFKQESLDVTVSLGLAMETASMENYSSLINEADVALYQAKKAGKNRVVIADSGL